LTSSLVFFQVTGQKYAYWDRLAFIKVLSQWMS
jgi:hypothetical protein